MLKGEVIFYDVDKNDKKGSTKRWWQGECDTFLYLACPRMVDPHEIFKMFCYFIQLGFLTIPVIFSAIMKNKHRGRVKINYPIFCPTFTKTSCSQEDEGYAISYEAFDKEKRSVCALIICQSDASLQKNYCWKQESMFYFRAQVSSWWHNLDGSYNGNLPKAIISDAR